MKRFLSVLLLLSSSILPQTKIAILDPGNKFGSDVELQAAFQFLKSQKEISSSVLNYDDLIRRDSGNLSNYDILWIHRADSSAISGTETDARLLERIDKYIAGGGKLLLTLEALRYLNLLGFEKERPQVQYSVALDEGYGRKLGFHSLRSHPVFEGMNGGAYLFNPLSDMKTRQIGFFNSSVPAAGKVVAVDWSYITLKEDSKLIVEYEIGKGKVLAVGAYIYLGIENGSRAHLELFLNNCFGYLVGKKGVVKKYYWNYNQRKVIPLQNESAGIVSTTNASRSDSKSWDKDGEVISIPNKFASDNFWNVAGERILAMGKEKGGIDEIWAHPFMALRDYEVGIQFSYRDSIYWLKEERPQIETGAGSFTRIYKFRRAYLTEIISAHPSALAAVAHYEYRGVYPAKLIIKFKSNLRYMWPYSEKALGSLCYVWNEQSNSFRVNDESGDFVLTAGANKKPAQLLIGQFDGFEKRDSLFHGIETDETQVAALSQYQLKMNDNLDFVIAASSEGVDAAKNHFEAALQDPQAIYKAALNAARQLLAGSLVITSPDAEFNAGYKWALIGTDRFFVNTPGLGKALVAGYSTTAKGWNGGHKINGRPGYAWYFGRDAVWSSFALLDYGDFEKVKLQLEFFNRYQDLNGKIFHELTTSGAVHYDASDSTPLYIILAGRYLLHSGDHGFIEKSWAHIKKAIEYCYSTDTDSDGLIENTNVGHGWVEGGGLYTAHTEVYLAACWAEALRMAGIISQNLGLHSESEKYFKDAARVREIINRDFWNDGQQFLSFSKLKNGSFNPEKTVLAAVPLYFDSVDRPKAEKIVDEYAGNYFSSDWGVRILREDSPIFNPRGYHTGSVWPLFTGWSALAEFKYGNKVQGFTHLMNNLLVYKNWQLGFVEEVLHGSEYKPAGVCPHQCWSETMVLQPAIEGLLGLEVDALSNTIKLSPRFPADWDSAKAERIKIGNNFVDFSFYRRNGKSQYHFRTSSGMPVKIIFKPSFPHGTNFINADFNGSKADVNQFRKMEFVFDIDSGNPAALSINHSGGIAVLPKIYLPKPNSASEGFRILSDYLEAGNYFVKVQGIAGSSNEFNVWRNEKIETIKVKLEEGSGKYSETVVKIVVGQQTE